MNEDMDISWRIFVYNSVTDIFHTVSLLAITKAIIYVLWLAFCRVAFLLISPDQYREYFNSLQGVFNE